jgi:hypothetical protein
MHIDMSFLSTLKQSYTFDCPLVVQLFPKTSNQENWCLFCPKSEIMARVDRFGVSSQLCLMKRFRMHQSTDGWNTVAHANLLTIPVLSIILLACCAAAAARLARSKRLRL